MTPPLALYVHLPWCVRKCPYCDFNSHALRASLPETTYVDALLRDLEHDRVLVEGRTIESVFLGGGTPSLFSPDAVARLLDGLRARLALAPDAEITLEANPGTVERERFRGFRAAGVNRLSIGVQSFAPAKLAALGRIHGRDEAIAAAQAAHAAGFDNFNLDLMYGLPDQRIEEALADLHQAIALAPAHLSVYQLTLEPHTPFHRHPPKLPDEDALAAMQEGLEQALAAAGYRQYEVSAYARPGRECRHNRNYWEFGDYLGLGAGAHGKITRAGAVLRTLKPRHPDAYVRAVRTGTARTERALAPADLVAEFMLNALRLRDGFRPGLFTERTGQPLALLQEALAAARAEGLLEVDPRRIRPSARGWRYLNDLVMRFLPPATAGTDDGGSRLLERAGG
jgi:oxygen-independent coproporphyrinogen-3 oxidase